MTPVEFLFLAPDGTPIADTVFEVQLAESSFRDDEAGVLMPRKLFPRTDAEGKVTLELKAALTPYFLLVKGRRLEGAIAYSFYVPVSDTTVRIQDILMFVPPSNLPYDEEAIRIITEMKVAAIAAADSAIISAIAAAESIETTRASAQLATDQAAAASDSAALAQEWAIKMVGPVEVGEYSAKYWADVAAQEANKVAARVSVTPAGGIEATDVQTALEELDSEATIRQELVDTKAPIADPTFTGVVSGVTQDMVGLGNVDNTSDVDKPIGTSTQATLDTKEDKVVGKGLSTEDYTTAEKAKLAGVEGGAQVNDIPVDALDSLSAELPLSASQGKVLKGLIDTINTLLQSDDATLDELQEIVNYVKLNRSDLDALGIPSIAGLEDALANKQPLSATLTATTAAFTSALLTKLNGIAAGAQVNTVTGVAGRAGDVVLAKSDVGLSSVDNTSDVNKPVSTAQGVAIAEAGKKLSTDHYGPNAPATTWAGMKWADSGAGLNKRRNDANSGWIVEGKLFKKPVDQYPVAPLTDEGPIYLVGTGPMEWDDTASAYVAKSGGAKGGGANKAFYPNDPVISEDMVLTADQNWHSVGPLRIEAGVIVEGDWVIS